MAQMLHQEPQQLLLLPESKLRAQSEAKANILKARREAEKKKGTTE